MTLLWNSQYHPTYHVEGSVIADLELSPQLPQSSQPRSTTNATRNDTTVNGRGRQELRAIDLNVPQQQQPAAKEPFVDPAILSFKKPAPATARDQVNIELAASPEPTQSTIAVQSARASSATAVPIQSTRERKDSSATATLTEPFDHMALNGDTAHSDRPGSPSQGLSTKENVPISTMGKGTVKKNKKGAKIRAKELASQTAPGVIDMKDLQSPPASSKKSNNNTRGKGWRQTPLIEEPSPVKLEPNQGRSKQKGHRTRLEDVSGWATEDATDIQDMGDFDFESNLSKFDKRRVFDDIRREDTTADEDRLVSFNRRARPGTNGGKNLHFTENVLGPPEQANNLWTSEANESEAEIHEDHYSSGRGSRRNTSRKPLPSRKSSTVPIASSLIRGVSRLESPRPGSRLSTAASPINGSIPSNRASLRLASTNKPCICVSPLNMLEIEQLCLSELGMTEDMLAENAGRGIAEAMLKMPPNLTINSKALFLIGNHKSGARAVAGARHLRNRGVRVVLCVLGGDREEILLESLRRQLDVYKKCGGWVTKWDEFQSKFPAASESPPELVVDALLGTHVAFDELRTSDQAIAFEMMRWTDRAGIPILSIEVPSGLDGSSGEITQVDNAPLFLQSQYVVCMGAPRTGLLHALVNSEGFQWQLVVADIGICKAAWRKFGSRTRPGVDFGKEWVLPLKFVDGIA